ncbi:MAG: carboxypeptidase regulatory-like domain-containing protein [Planctomycetes bacterium]|nr:carboxypeptidase regulatory-like domain-containing protein [Planctomycetota bacterium]
MRPIPVLFALAALVLALLGALLFFTGSGSAPTLVAESGGAPLTAEPLRTPAEIADVAQVGAARAVQSGSASEGAQAAATTADAPGRARRVTGRVLDESGRPVPGALVLAAGTSGFDELALDEVDPLEMPWMRRVETRTDAEGRFALEPRAEARVRLAVRAAGFAPLDVERPLSESKPELGDLVVQRGVVVEGRVVDHLGRPVEGAELRRRRAASGPMALFAGRGGAVAARTDAQGAFRVDVLAAGPWSLRVTSEAAPDKDESGETTRPGEIVRGLVIQLEEGFEISGRLSGAPPAEATLLRVAAIPGGPGFGGDFGPGLGQRLAPVAADGSFVVRGLRKEARVRLSARLATQGFGAMLRSPTRSNTVEAVAGERGVELAYRAETALVFQVVDATSGAPITDMSVAAGARFAAPLTDERNRAVRNFPEGRVRYGGLRVSGMGFGGRGAASSGAPQVTVRVEAAGYAPWERTDVRVVEGQDNDLGVVRLERTSVVTVRVTSAASGAPVVGARVTLEAVRDEAGGPGGARSFTFRAGLGGDDDDGLEFGGGAAQRARTDAQGLARVSSLPGSRARIRVTHAEHAELVTEPIDLPRGADVERALALSAGGTLVVRVVDPRGAPVVGQAIEHQAPGAGDEPAFLGPGGAPVTDAEGRVTLSRLSPGTHAVRLAASDAPRIFGAGGGAMRVALARSGSSEAPPEEPWTEVVVQEGGQHETVLTAPERARVTGRVREGGRPLAGATVRLRAKGGDDLDFLGEGPRADTDGQGEYALENVAVGEYVLSVAHPGRAMAHELELRVRTGETRENVELPLSILEGRVVDEQGQGVAGLRVRAERRGGGGVSRREFVFAVDAGDGPVSFGGGGGGTVTTDAEGRYRLRGVSPDTDLVVTASGQGVQRVESEVVRVPVDGTRAGVDLVARQGASLEVLCRRPDGSPATPCEVRAELVDETDRDTKFEITRGDGRVRFQGLKPGRWRVTARPLGTGPGDSTATPVEQTVELSVGTPGQITLDVRGA